MAITRIELPAVWLAGLQSYNSDRTLWNTTIVNNPIQQNDNIFAWDTTSSSFGHMLGFNHELLTKALRDDNNATMKLKMRLSYTQQSTMIGVHTLLTVPSPYSNIGGFKYSHTVGMYWDSSGWSEKDITPLRQYLMGDATGLTVLPDGMLDEAYEPTIIIEGNWTPNSPILESPVGGVLKDRTKILDFKWVYDGIYPQTGFDLRYRIKGTSIWTTISENTPNNFYGMAANTLSAGEYEWQVRTKFQSDVYGSWSTLGVFNATDETNAPVVLEPTPGQVLPTQDLFIEWVPESNQVQHEVELFKGNQKVNSSLKTSANSKETLKGWLENNESYIIRLRVLVEGQLWSDWSEVNVSVSYTAPAKPILTFVEDEETASLKIDVYNPPPTGTEPAPVSQELFRRKGNGSWIKLANLLPNTKYVDRTLASGRNYQYRSIVLADNDVSSTSHTYTESIQVFKSILALANNPAEFIQLDRVRERSSTSDLNATQRKFAGRKLPVTEFGETIRNDLNIECLVFHDEYEALLDLVHKQETLIYRDARGRKRFVTVPTISINDEFIERYSIELPLNEVYFDEAVD